MSLTASIIVPVYNTEHYLKRCLDSLLAQTYQHFEILLVDDGSTDRSGDICDAYGRQDMRVTVIHQQNGGVSAARNTGLKACKGDILLFADSDDYVAPNLLSVVVTAFQHSHADLVQFNGRIVYGKKKAGLYGYEIFRYSEDTDYLRKWFLMGEDTSLWKRAYRRAAFPGMRFPDGCVYEDLYINVPTLLKAEKICAIPEVLYFYENEKHNSITQTRSLKHLAGMMAASMKNRDDLPDTQEYASYRELFRQQALMAFFFIAYYLHDEEERISANEINMAVLRNVAQGLICGADPWHAFHLGTTEKDCIQEFSYMTHCHIEEIEKNIMNQLGMDTVVKSKRILNYVLRVFCIDAVTHAMTDQDKMLFMNMLEKYSAASDSLVWRKKLLLWAARQDIDFLLRWEGRHLLRRGMPRE